MGSPIEAQVGQDDAAEWIDWAGGECPVDADAMVEVRLRIGGVVGPAAAHGLDWYHDTLSPDLDIVKYRVVVPQ